MHLIGLDVGHGLHTAGKQTPDGIKEWSIGDPVRDKVVAILSEYGCTFVHTDNDEGATDESLGSRLRKYLDANVEAFASMHHNAFTGKWNGATGVEVYVDVNATEEDLRLAECIYSRLVKYTGLTGRGIKRANFTVINQNKIPAVLVEGGFMDGTKDYKIITSEEGQDAYARAVAEGLIEFLGLEKIAGTTVVKTVDELAREIIKGIHGKGHDVRKASLASQGYFNYEEVRARVNEIQGVKTSVAKYFKAYKGKSGSIVTALNSIGATSSYEYREKIAKVNGIKSYKGSKSQNIKMLNLLKLGRLIKP